MKILFKILALSIFSTSVFSASISGQTMTAEVGLSNDLNPTALTSVYDSETFIVNLGSNEIGGNNQLYGVYESYGYVNVEEDSITMHGFNVGFGDLGGFNGYHFSDTLGTIDSFTSVLSNGSNALIDDSRITFSDDDIWINMSGLSLYGANNSLTLDFTTAAPIPEPSTYALMILGLGLIGFISSRRKSVNCI